MIYTKLPLTSASKLVKLYLFEKFNWDQDHFYETREQIMYS